VQAGLADDAADWLAKLHDDPLLCLIDDEARTREDEQSDHGDENYKSNIPHWVTLVF
jgi:hypothetical protein